MNSSTIVQQVQNTVSCEIDDQTVLLNIEAGKYHGFNEVASLIWQIIETPTSIDTICGQLREKFEVSEHQCQSDLIAFLKGLKKSGLITTGG